MDNYICSRCKRETPKRISSYIYKQAKWVISDIDDKETPDMYVLCPYCYTAFYAFIKGKALDREEEFISTFREVVFDSLDADDESYLSWIEDAPGIYRCPECGHTEGKKRNFCCDCGSKFIMEK